MWSQVGVTLEINQIPSVGQLQSIAAGFNYDTIAIGTSPDSAYPAQAHYTAQNWINCSRINDPYVNETADTVRNQAVTDFQGSMETARPLVMYLLEQAYVIPAPRYPTYTLWWPWLKNYDGEVSLGFFGGDTWAAYTWIDQNLKASMSH